MGLIFLTASPQEALGTRLWLPGLWTSHSRTAAREIQARELNAGCQISTCSDNIPPFS